MMQQKNFKEIYENIYASVDKEIEEKRKNYLKKLILMIIILIFVIFFLIFKVFNSNSLDNIDSSDYKVIFTAIIIIIVTSVMFFLIRKSYKNYAKSYKDLVINEIVEQSNSDLVYEMNNGISESEYRESNFDRGWDRYYSEDLITGKLEDGSTLKMSQVRTEERRESTDSNGHTSTTYITTFLGLYGKIKLKISTTADFTIKENSFITFNKNKKIEMESAEFEKYYDVFAGNQNLDSRQKAMEIITPDVIEQFIKIRNIFKSPLSIRISNGTLYFRINVGDIFEPPTFKNSLDFDLLKKYFEIVDVPRMIYETFIDNIILMYGSPEDRKNRIFAGNNNDEKEKIIQNEEASYFSHK